jgi:hypothetical protein
MVAGKCYEARLHAYQVRAGRLYTSPCILPIPASSLHVTVEPSFNIFEDPETLISWSPKNSELFAVIFSDLLG